MLSVKPSLRLSAFGYALSVSVAVWLVAGCDFQYELHIDNADPACLARCEEDDWRCAASCAKAAEGVPDAGSGSDGVGGGDASGGADPDPDPDPDADRDGDGVPDHLEWACDTHPDHADSDGDGLSDGDEDADRDGFTNAEEAAAGTDPADPRDRPTPPPAPPPQDPDQDPPQDPPPACPCANP